MGNRSRSNCADLISAMPEDVRLVFDEGDIRLVWDYLEETFKVNVKMWRQQFEDEFRTSSREFSKEELFVRFGLAHFEKPLNYLLYRSEGHQTWIGLIRFIVKEKIAEKQKERDELRNFYTNKKSYAVQHA